MGTGIEGVELQDEPIGAMDFEEIVLESHPHWREQYEELDDLTPHLYPIVVGALIDARITELLGSLFLEGKEARALLGPDGLGYKDKVRLAVATGLLPQELAKALYYIGYVRNHFAHAPAPSLTDEEVKENALGVVRELARHVFGTMFEMDSNAVGLVVSDAKRAFEEDRESMARGALHMAWLLCMVLFDAALSRTNRLVPVLEQQD